MQMHRRWVVITDVCMVCVPDEVQGCCPVVPQQESELHCIIYLNVHDTSLHSADEAHDHGQEGS